ncbi:metalloregulator ArsR/SmtB family transcription factor [Brevibacillus humidisoli]|uniref:metalloregulator ArsR/SmtB family transcription factor n=1 Tax=Brevibacillus humidisoli TaxID=2895522 RepID=UPI001E2C3812|nr:metalloregulator ArsR/SmtB family transcription factor [Brevibacillus humidisoli]UFJ40695.1 metalloregulator ArsR/SmtB family transcription factor [Brevibacillus humidisoli]
MQIDILVNFHKAVADVNRIRILSLLANKPMSGSELAERLGITPATITHHTQKLKKAGLIKEKRDKNTITFFLLPRELSRLAAGIVQTVLPDEREVLQEWEVWRGRTEQTGGGAASDSFEEVGKEMEKERIIAPFFTEDGRLKQIPAQWKKRMLMLERLAAGLEMGRAYSEKEISEYLKQFHEDYATLRREFIMNQIMYRANGIYTLNPRELWRSAE